MNDVGRCLLHWAERKPDAPAFLFALRDGTIDQQFSFGTLATRAMAIAARLRALDGHDERAALLFAPGVEFMAAILGCMLAGVVAVPMPLPRRLESRDSTGAIMANCTPRFILTTRDLMARLQAGLAERPQWEGRIWLAADDLAEDVQGGTAAAVTPGRLALLQYTSGSTSAPKGVMVSHANLMSNLGMMQASFGTSADSRFACWVPLYHDMGLISNALHALYLGARCILMAPLSFMQRPLTWLKIISEHRVDFAGCPNFGYDHCVDYLRSRPAQGLDLSSWQVAFNGAEPIRPATLDRFSDAFAPFGFERRALFPCYGMAEATVMISGKSNRAGPALLSSRDGKSNVSCGRALPGEEVAVVDPDSCRRRPAGAVGEIWVRGPHVAAGYWANPGATRETFDARIPGEAGAWLRTGDLGFLDECGELFVSGRLKDLIIVRGQNHYPQDIELAAQESHAAFHQHPGAAFVAPAGHNDAALIVVQEADHRLRRQYSTGELEAAIREAVALEHGLAVHHVAIVPPGSVPRTTSGKVRRARARALWLEGALGSFDG